MNGGESDLGCWNENGYGKVASIVQYWVWCDPISHKVTLERAEFVEPNDNQWDPGEQVSIITSLKAVRKDFTKVTATLSTNDPYLTIGYAGPFDFGTISAGSISNNSSNPFTATAKQDCPPHKVKFILNVNADTGTVYTTTIPFTHNIGLVPCEKVGEFPCPYDEDVLTYGLAFDGTNLWMTSFYGKKICKLDYEGNKIGEIPAPDGDSCVDLDYDSEGYLWVQSFKTKKIYKISPSNGNIITNFPSPAARPTGLAFDGTYLWVVDIQKNKIYKTDKNGRVERSFDIPSQILSPLYGPRCLAYDRVGETLILYMTYWRREGGDTLRLDSTRIYELTTDGRYTGKTCRGKGNGRIVCYDHIKGQYWIDGGKHHSGREDGKINKIMGFHPIGVEESIPSTRVIGNLTVFPNPTRNNVIITLYVPHTNKVSVNIHDISGRVVYRVVDKVFQPGSHKLTWNGTEVPSGVYFCRVATPDFTITNKLILLR